MINALVVVHTHTLTLPFAVRDSLKELRHLFAPFLRHPSVTTGMVR